MKSETENTVDTTVEKEATKAPEPSETNTGAVTEELKGDADNTADTADEA